MADVHDPADVLEEVPDDRVYRWVVRTLYVTLLAANLYLVWDWYRDTPEGQAMVVRCRARLAAIKKRAEECEGCARRRAMLQAAVNRMQWQAERIVEGDDVPTEPEQQPPAS